MSGTPDTTTPAVTEEYPSDEVIAARKSQGWHCGRALVTGHCDEHPPTSAVTEEDRAKAAAPVLIAQCGNDLWELSRGAAPVMTRCAGLLRFRWGMTQAACDTCGAWCGVAVANWEAVENAAERGKADALRAAMHALAEEWDRRQRDLEKYPKPLGWGTAAARLRAIADGQR